MFVSEGFTFDGVHSSTYNIKQVRFNSGFFQQNFAPNRAVLEDPVASRDKPFFYGVESSPLEFTMRITKEGE